MIANPPVINVDGDITVHSKSSMALSIAFKDAVGAARDMSALTVYFSTSSGLHILMTAGGSTDQKVLTVTTAQLTALAGKVTQFAVVDETVSLNSVLWEGNIIVRGWV